MAEDKRAILSDDEIDNAMEGTSFGMPSREVVEQAVLKHASGLYQGHTTRMVAVKLGLIQEEGGLSEKGKSFLWASFKVENSI